MHFAHGLRPCAALLVVFAASIAALAAHIAIDVLGDVLLAHDTYDDVAHQSRAVISCTALAVVAGAALRLLLAALDGVRTVPHRRSPLNVVDPRSLGMFVLLVVAASLVLLAGMEMADLAIAGQSFDDCADLLGGSIWLGAGVTLPIALSAAYLVGRIARWATVVEVFAIALVSAWFMRRERRTPAARVGSRRTLRSFARLPALARSTPRRGPPPFLTTAALPHFSAR